MPYLSPPERDAMLGAVDAPVCPRCGQAVRKGYCRECDEFFYKCELCNLPHGHEGHRTYER
jgi:predicted RNA-binding Zn-ribbon protein involved in translation (DUF1610 family)